MRPEAPVAGRARDIAPFRVMELLAKARALEAAGRAIVHMEVGEPDFPTPEPIVQAGTAALRDGKTHYTPARGLPQLREAISAYYASQFQVAVDPQRILVTPGASGALQLVMAARVEVGQAVVFADPGYPCYRHFTRLVEGRPLAVPVGPDTGYQLTADLLRAAAPSDVAAVMLATPANPTGTLIPVTSMQAMQEWAVHNGAHLIVDEIYQGLTYEAEPYTALTVADDVFIINSFSKYYGMTGWRIGWLVAPPAYVDALDRLAQNLFLASSTPAQYAALAAFDGPVQAIAAQRRQEFMARRDYLLQALPDLGFEVAAKPQGAFYIYADCSCHSDDSYAFCERLLQEAGVAVTPGIDFGDHQAATHLRFAYTSSMAQLRTGVQRLRAFLTGRP